MKNLAKITILAIAITTIAQIFAGIQTYKLGKPENSITRTISQPCEVAQIRASGTGTLDLTIFTSNFTSNFYSWTVSGSSSTTNIPTSEPLFLDIGSKIILEGS
jgi:hypothetical protein